MKNVFPINFHTYICQFDIHLFIINFSKQTIILTTPGSERKHMLDQQIVSSLIFLYKSNIVTGPFQN